MSQQHRTTLGTASAIFNRLRYYTENGVKANIQSGSVYTENVVKANIQSRQDNRDLGDMSQQHRTTLGTASAIFNRLKYYTENWVKANLRSEIQDRGPQGQRENARDNGKPGTGETFHRPHEVIRDTLPRASDTCTPEGDNNREPEIWTNKMPAGR